MNSAMSRKHDLYIKEKKIVKRKGLHLVVFFCCSVPVVCLTPQDSPQVLTRCNCRVLIFLIHWFNWCLCGSLRIMFGSVSHECFLFWCLCTSFIWLDAGDWVAGFLGRSCRLGSPGVQVFVRMYHCIFPFDVGD